MSSNYNNRLNYSNPTNPKYSTSRIEDTNNRYNQFKQSYNFNSITSPKFESSTPQNYQINNNQIIPEHDQSDYDKVNILKKQFDLRIKSLYSELKSIVNKIETDEILHTMKKDVTTTEYYSQRVSEIVDERLHLEREEIVKKLNEDYAEIKEKFSISERQNIELIERIKSLSDSYDKKLDEGDTQINHISNEYNKLKANMQNLNSTYDNEIKKVYEDFNSKNTKQNQEISKLKEDNSNNKEKLSVNN